MLTVVTHWFVDYRSEAWTYDIMRSGYSVGGVLVVMKSNQWRMKPKSFNSLPLNSLDLPQ